MSKFKIFLKNIFLLLFVLAVIFVIGEISCRLFFKENDFYKKWIRHGLTLSQLNGEGKAENKFFINAQNGLAYNLKNGLLDGSFYVAYQSDGLIKEKKKAGTFRVIILGDSFTVGRGLEKEETQRYVSKLANLMNDKSAISIKNIDQFEFLAFAFDGLNTVQELALLRETALAYQPDLVILQYCNNDILSVRNRLDFIQNDNVRLNLKTDLLVFGDRLAPVFPYLNRNLSAFLLENSAFFRFVSYKMDLIMFAPDKSDQEASLEALKEMKKITMERGIPFMVINFSLSSVEQDYCGEISGFGGKKLYAQLKSLADEMGFPFYNICDYVKNIHDIRSGIEKYPTHYNEAGHEVAAQILKQAIIDILKK